MHIHGFWGGYIKGCEMQIPNSPDFCFAIEAAAQAGKLARLIQQEIASPAMVKEDRSPVTVADFAVQALIGVFLEEYDSSSVLVAEENAAALRQPDARNMLERVAAFVRRFRADATPERICRWIDRGNGEPAGAYWVLDPIDGTKGFLRGEQYAVALARIEQAKVRLGVLACPNLADPRSCQMGGPGSLVAAFRGGGTWLRGMEGGVFEQLHVSGRGEPAEARVLRSAEAAHTNVSRLDRILAHMGVAAEPVRMDSQAKYAVMAAGSGELLFRLLSSRQPDYRERIWDQAAGSLVVEEAGGRITDLGGAPLDFSAGRMLERNRGVLASNGKLHEYALQALTEVE